jgi:vacuolar-type H+-ATPase subunit I/STV1
MNDCDKCGAHWMQSCQCVADTTWGDIVEISSEERIFLTNKDASIFEMNKKIQKLQAQLDSTKKEYKYFASSFENFFKFMQENYSDVEYIGNTHQDNAVKVIKNLQAQLESQSDDLAVLKELLDEANGYLFKALPYLNDEFDGYYGETSVTRFKKEVLKYLEKYKVKAQDK